MVGGLRGLGICLVLVLGACAHSPQVADIRPEIAGPLEKVADGQAILLDMRDDRLRARIGRRGDATGGQAAITAPGDLMERLAHAVLEGFAAQGFAPALRAKGALPQANEPVLRVSLRDLDYHAQNKILAGYVITVTAAVTLRMAGFEETYRSEQRQDAYITPGADANNALINKALNAVLAQALHDPGLRSHMLTRVAAAPARE